LLQNNNNEKLNLGESDFHKVMTAPPVILPSWIYIELDIYALKGLKVYEENYN
jgi:hypothetical protein